MGTDNVSLLLLNVLNQKIYNVIIQRIFYRKHIVIFSGVPYIARESNDCKSANYKFLTNRTFIAYSDNNKLNTEIKFNRDLALKKWFFWKNN